MGEELRIPDYDTRRANLVRMLKAKPEWGADRILALQDDLTRRNGMMSLWYRLKWWVKGLFDPELRG